MQRIVIKNFGPIKDVDIPIHDFMIFIGPQASGKSTIAKAVYFFQELPETIYQFLFISAEDIIKSDFTKIIEQIPWQMTSLFEEFFFEKTQEGLSIKYIYESEKDISLEFTFQDNRINVLFSDNLRSEFNRLLTGLIETAKTNGFISRPLIDEISSPFFMANFRWGRRNVFIPAGRSLFSILANQFLVPEKGVVPYEMKQYAYNINALRSLYKRGAFKNASLSDSAQYNLASKLAANVLKGAYLNKGKNDIIEIESGIEILLENASSGQQESLWILLDLFYEATLNEIRFLVIEEPEAHLYPEAQKYISEMIALAANKGGNNVIITTHSPYILGAINNLIYANNVGKTHPVEVEKLVDKNLWLDYDRVMAYFVDTGKVRPIMDEEMRMINNSEIDSASRIINEEFDSLFNLAYSE